MDNKLITKALEDIGFTAGESKVYISLLKLGESKVGPIIKLSEISRSKVYDILNKLINKGIVGKIDKNKVMFFRALEPENILKLIKEKKENLELEEKNIKELLPTLLSIGANKDIKVSVYEGYEGFKSVIDKTINELDKKDFYDVMGISKTTDEMTRYANKIYQVQSMKKFKARSIFDELGAYKIPERKNPLHEIKILPKGWHTPALFTMYKDNVGIHIGNDEKIISILIKSEDIAQSFKTNFEAMWKIAKLVKN